jgi:hypothetical protein
LTITANKTVPVVFLEMNYKMAPATKPKSMHIHDSGAKTDCVYSPDGDTLQIARPLRQATTGRKKWLARKGVKRGCSY